MVRTKRGLWRYALWLFLALPSVAQAAIAWTAIKPTDCTGAGAPTGCCVVAAPGANASCLNRNSAGQLFVVRADLKSDGGTYTVGGDTVTGAALGLTSLLWADCTGSTGQIVVPLPQANGSLKIKLFSAVGTENTAAAVAATIWLQCDIYGR